MSDAYWYLRIKNGNRHLNLRYENLGDKRATKIATALRHPTDTTTVETLVLWHNHIGDEGAMALAEALKVDSTLEVLFLANNNIGEKGATALAEALKHHSSLQILWKVLPHKVLGIDVAHGLWEAHNEAWRTSSKLQQLELNMNNIGDKGVAALAGALKTNSTLKGLWLARNNIGVEGATAMAEALTCNSKLQGLWFLSLSHNIIRDKGAKVLAKALKRNSTLQELNLDDNNIGKEGAKSLVDALKHNSTLRELDLDDNNISNALDNQITRLLSKNNGFPTWKKPKFASNDIEYL
jgi:NLR family CARD domain-containing protein 3